MITIGFPPRHIGGTELYVQSLVESLQKKRQECQVACIESFKDKNQPEICVKQEQYNGITIDRILVNAVYQKLKFLPFNVPLREKVISQFLDIISPFQPDIIHLHPLQLGFEAYLIEALKRKGHKTIITYHTPLTSCARGDLLFMGKTVCDGVITPVRCSQCLFHKKNVPGPLAMLLSRLPLKWYQYLFQNVLKSRYKYLKSFITVPIIINERIKNWGLATSNATAVLAISQWVQNIFINNHLPPEKVSLIRNGMRTYIKKDDVERCGIPRFGYLGRLTESKGVKVLINALKAIPSDVEFIFEFYSTFGKGVDYSSKGDEIEQALLQLERSDKRIRLIPDNKGDISAILSTLIRWDALVMPSVWLENGPLVIYEAFSVKTPVIGSRRGGIAELVKEGKTGFLFEPGNFQELANLLQIFAKNPQELRALRKNIPPVRTIETVAGDVLEVYKRCNVD